MRLRDVRNIVLDLTQEAINQGLSTVSTMTYYKIYLNHWRRSLYHYYQNKYNLDTIDTLELSVRAFYLIFGD